MAGGLTWFIISRQSRSAADSWNCTKCKQSIPGTQPSGVTLCKKCRQTNSESWNCADCSTSIPGTQPPGVTLCEKCRQTPPKSCLKSLLKWGAALAVIGPVAWYLKHYKIWPFHRPLLDWQDGGACTVSGTGGVGGRLKYFDGSPF